MIKEALEFLVGLKPVALQQVNGEYYSTEKMHHIEPVLEPAPSAVTITTLTGLVDYISNNVDQIKETLIVHVVSPTEVKVFSELKEGAVRHNFINVKGWVPSITFDRFVDVESFNIMLQTCFLDSEDKAAILRVVGNIKEDNVRNTGDNGISQVVTAKKGVSTVEDVVLPNPVTLFPFRSFAEVDQAESKFVFRMKDGPSAALYEADGGQWRLFAMQNIKDYLTEKLQGFEVKIIS